MDRENFQMSLLSLAPSIMCVLQCSQKKISVQLWRKSIWSQLRYILYLRATLPNPKKQINRSKISQSNKITSAGLSGQSKLWKFEQTPATFHYTPFLYSQMKRITSFSLQFYLYLPPLWSDILIYAARLQPNTICHSPRCSTSVASELCSCYTRR